MLGLLFPNKKESALSLLPGSIGTGYFIAFMTGIYLSYITQLWIICGLTVLTTVAYSIVFFTNATKEQLAPCVYRELKQDDFDKEANEEYTFIYKDGRSLSIGPSITVENGVQTSTVIVSLNKETPVYD